jgi:hypothetical protein
MKDILREQVIAAKPVGAWLCQAKNRVVLPSQMEREQCVRKDKERKKEAAP